MMFPEGADPAVVAWVQTKANAAQQPAVIALLRDAPTFKMTEALAAVDIPVRAINAAPRPNGGFPTAVAINRKYGDYDAVLMEGVGHYLQLEQPAEFNAHLRAVLAELTE